MTAVEQPTADAEAIDAEVVEGTDEDVVTGEVVDPTTAAMEVAPDRTALDQAAEAALMPGVAGRDEFLSLAMQARMLSMSGAAPKAVRGNPYVALHVAMIGRDLGISPSASLELIDVIGEGDKTQLSLSPQLLAGQVRRLGLGRIGRGKSTRTMCEAIAFDPAGNELGRSEFTWEDAMDAELVNPRCTSPDDHHCQNLPWREKCRQGWRTYPRRRLWWRAAGYCVDDFFPEAGLGLYTAEELGVAVDDEGRAIDPTTVPLPEGYEDTTAPRAPTTRGEPLAPDSLASLERRIGDLPDAHKVVLRGKWKERNLPPLGQLTKGDFAVADALVQAEVLAAHREAEGQATTDEAQAVVDADQAVDVVRDAFHSTAGEPPSDEDPLDGPVAPAEPSGVGSLPTPLATALEDVPAALVDEAVDAVRLLPLKGVNSALSMRGIKPTGTLDYKRRVLAASMAVEAHAEATALVTDSE